MLNFIRFIIMLFVSIVIFGVVTNIFNNNNSDASICYLLSLIASILICDQFLEKP